MRVVLLALYYKQPQYVDGCIRSLLSQSHKSTVFVVDNASGDGEIERIKSTYPTVITRVMEANYGYAKTYNIVLRECFSQGYDACIAVNMDIIADPHMVKELVASFERAKKSGVKVGLLQPAILLMSDPTKINTIGNAVHWSGFGYCPDYKKPDSIIPEKDVEIKSVSGCCMCISREYFAEVGSFDERFFMYMEDQEYSARGRSLGHTHLLSTKSRVLHDYSFKMSFGKIIMLAKGWVVSLVTHSTRARVQRILFIFGFLCSHLVKGVFVYKDYISLHIKLFISRVGAVVQMRDGARYMVRSGYFDIATLDQIYIEHVYDPPGFELRDADVVFDVGGYIGDYAVYAARRTPKGHVYSFEPVLETFQLLKKNKELNSLSNLSCFQYGLSDSNRSVVFHTGTHVAQPGASEYALDKMGYNTSGYKKESVVLRRFDEVARELGIQQIDVLKIDCEGEEFALLYGLDKSLLQTCRICMIEYHDIHRDARYTGAALGAYLAECGFTVTRKQYKLASNTGMLYAKKFGFGGAGIA